MLGWLVGWLDLAPTTSRLLAPNFQFSNKKLDLKYDAAFLVLQHQAQLLVAGISASKLPKGIEGGSIVSLLTNPKQPQVKRPREELVFHFPHYQTADGPHSALMLGNLKLMKFYEGNRLALFDLSKDIGEQNDLSGRMPQQTEQLQQQQILDRCLLIQKIQVIGFLHTDNIVV